MSIILSQSTETEIRLSTDLGQIHLVLALDADVVSRLELHGPRPVGDVEQPGAAVELRATRLFTMTAEPTLLLLSIESDNEILSSCVGTLSPRPHKASGGLQAATSRNQFLS